MIIHYKKKTLNDLQQQYFELSIKVPQLQNYLPLNYIEDLMVDARSKERTALYQKQDDQRLKLDNKTAWIMKQWAKQEPISFDKAESSRTQQLRQLDDRKVSTNAKARYQKSDFGLSMQSRLELQNDFLSELFYFFSNSDEDLPESLVFQDYMHLLRLCNIVSSNEIPDGIYDFHNKEIDIKQMEEEEGFIQYEEAIRIYRKNSNQPWKNHVYSMDLKDFSRALYEIVQSLFGKKKNIKSEFMNFVYDIIYPNALLNVPDLGKRFLRADLGHLHYQGRTQEFINLFQVSEGNNRSPVDDLISRHIVNKANLEEDQQKRRGFEQKIEREKKEKESKKQLGCCQNCCQICCRFLRRVFCFWTKNFQNNGKKEEIDEGQRSKQQGLKRKRMGDWKLVAEEVVEEMVAAHNEYTERHKGAKYDFVVNFSNVMALYGRLSDTYTIAIVAFNDHINWIPGQSAQSNSVSQNQLSLFDGRLIFENLYQILFYISLGISLLYGGLALYAFKFMRNDTLGLDEEGNKAEFPSKQFLLTKLVSFLGASQFMMVMSTFLDSFSCDFAGTFRMVRDPSVECISDQHMIYMMLALFGLIIYYPLSTFLYPNFQFGDRSLDLKYSSEYLVVYVQCKLLVLSNGSFLVSFGTPDTLLGVLQCGFATVIMTALLLLYVRVWPCYIQWFNYMEISCFIIIISLNVGGMIIGITGNQYIGIAIAGGGTLISTMLSIYYYKRFHHLAPSQAVIPRTHLNHLDLNGIKVQYHLQFTSDKCYGKKRIGGKILVRNQK